MSEQYFSSNKDFDSMKKILSPRVDVVFQALFGELGSERITGGFLKSILKKEISDVDLSQNIVLRRQTEEDKLGILDVLAKLNGKENCNIEMQLDDTGELKERILYYWSRVYARQLKKNERYKELEKTIVILITNFNIEGLEELGYHTEWKIIDRKTGKVILTDKLEFHIIEMSKVKEKHRQEKLKDLENSIKQSKSKKEGKKMEEKGEERDELLDWVQFLQEPLSEYVIEKTKDNEELREAVEKLKEISEDERIQRLAWLREKAILDENSRKDYAMRKGMEKGMEKGMKKGMEKGMKEGIEKGEKKAKLETAKKMLQEKISIEVIMRVTGLSKAEIVSLR